MSIPTRRALSRTPPDSDVATPLRKDFLFRAANGACPDQASNVGGAFRPFAKKQVRKFRTNAHNLARQSNQGESDAVGGNAFSAGAD
jgi:hypothetical protein